MRHTSAIKKKVMYLRQRGLSLGQINEKTNVPRTTIRLWVKEIPLSQEQLAELKQRTQFALQKGRIAAQRFRMEQNLKKRTELFRLGEAETRLLTKRELFITGVALYWGEGFKNKHEHRLGFCNADSDMIILYIKWLKTCLGVKDEDLVARLTLNASYADKEKKIREFWSRTTQIPQGQFTKTFYQHTKWKKQYKTEEYIGVLRIHVRNSVDYLAKMHGWIAGLKHAKISHIMPG